MILRTVTEALGDGHDLEYFDSGKPELDIWLHNSARHAERNRTCRTFVWHFPDDNTVIAYFSLSAHLIARTEMARIFRGSPDKIPAILLARLALHKDFHGQGLGSILLTDALQRAVTAALHTGARFVVTDAIDDKAASFYAAHGFTPIPGDEYRLVRKMSDIAHDLGMPY